MAISTGGWVCVCVCVSGGMLGGEMCVSRGGVHAPDPEADPPFCEQNDWQV